MNNSLRGNCASAGRRPSPTWRNGWSPGCLPTGSNAVHNLGKPIRMLLEHFLLVFMFVTRSILQSRSRCSLLTRHPILRASRLQRVVVSCLAEVN
jgi:hypothetical protein